MKLPVVANATAFASGIAIALWPVAANYTPSRGFVFGEASAALLLIAAAIFFLCLQFLRWAAIFSLSAWLVLGFFGASIAREPSITH